MSDLLRDVFGLERDWMRKNGRVPRKLTIIVDLPEIPMGNESGVNTTQHIDYAEVASDPGYLGAALRSLMKRDPDG